MVKSNYFIQSPLNYTGGKYKLLKQILPNFPNEIDTFVDLFCGGCNVGINIEAKKVVYNDLNKNLLYLYNTFKNLDKETTFYWIYHIIKEYNLSLVSKHGYSFYNCESSKGLGDYNRNGFLKLRADFNNKTLLQNEDYYYYIMLFVMIVYASNNQIRFNSNGEFNLPVGKRDFNNKIQDKLSKFIDRLKEQNSVFTCLDFRNFNIETLTENDFVYADPPYLITCATYNEQGGWTEKDEYDLLAFLVNLSKNRIKFALSNVLSSKGKENKILKAWVERNINRYRVIHLNYNYANSNYQTKDKTKSSDEVLIVNY